MRKLSKFHLSGGVSILSVIEQQRLVGGDTDGCVSYGKYCAPKACRTNDKQGQAGYCGWNKGTHNCECLVSY